MAILPFTFSLGGISGRRALRAYLPPSSSLSAFWPGTDDPVEIFDQDSAKALEYRRRWRYYEGDQYSTEALEERTKEQVRRAGGAGSSQVGPLYNFIKSFYNIVPRTVNTDVSSIFREPTQFQPKKRGNRRLETQLDRLVRVSHLETERFQATRFGGVTGDVYLRIGKDAESGLARIYVHPPDVIRVQHDEFDRTRIAYAILTFPYRDLRTGDTHTRTDLYWPDEIQTFRDGELFNFDGNGSRQENPLGVVPVVQVKNLDVGTRYGLPSYAEAIPTIDAVNEVLSFLVTILKINADPIILAYGIEAGGLRKGAQTDMQGTTVWHVPVARQGMTEVKLLEWKGNLPDIIGMLQEVTKETRDSLPELHLSKMQEVGTMSGFALNSMMFPFVDKITNMRVNYAGQMRLALSMALAYQAILDGRATGFDMMDARYDTEIILPPVLPINEDELLNRIIALLQARLIGREEALRMRGIPEDEIQRILQEADASWERLQTIGQAAETTAQQQENQRTLTAGQGRKTPADRAQDATNGQPLNQQLNAPPNNG